MERIIYLSVALSIILWFVITIIRMDSRYNLNNALDVIFNVTVVVIVTSLPEKNREKYLFQPFNLLIYIFSLVISAFVFPYIGVLLGPNNKNFYMQYRNKEDFDELFAEFVVIFGFFGVTFISNARCQQHNLKGLQYMRVYGFIIAICIILCVITITLNSIEKKLHIHHYVVGFAFAVCNVSNHPLSILVLGSAMGVMVEGLTMHGVFPTIYTPSNCGKIQNRYGKVYIYKHFCCSLQEIGHVQICTVDNKPLSGINCTSSYH